MESLIEIAIELAAYYYKGLRLLHVGAGIGQEIDNYLKHGVEPVCIEGNAKSAQVIKEKYPEVQLFQAVVSDYGGERLWYPTHPPECSSLHEIDRAVALKHFPSIQSLKPTTVSCTTVDDLSLPPVGAIVLDVQGHEYEVLAGAEETLESCEIVVCEVWLQALYKGTKLLAEVQAYLEKRGFELRKFLPGSKPSFWGDAIFMRGKAWLF